MANLRYIVSAVIFFSSLFSQANNVVQIIDIPSDFAENEFYPTKFNVNTTGIYFLDSESRQIAFVSKNEEVIYSGGYGVVNDAFIDPIDIISSKLRIFVIDRTENTILEFDHRLNYLGSKEIAPIYPEYGGIDDWGNIYLYSEQEQSILQSQISQSKFIEHIDLSLWYEINNCVKDIYFAQDGSIGILSNCSKFIYVFNRLGKLQNNFLIHDIETNNIVKIGHEWITISYNGDFINLSTGEIVDLDLEEPILDIAQSEDLFYLLFSNKIWVVDVSVE